MSETSNLNPLDWFLVERQAMVGGAYYYAARGFDWPFICYWTQLGMNDAMRIVNAVRGWPPERRHATIAHAECSGVCP